MGRTRFMITSLTSHFTRIAVGDCRDGILFYSYHEVGSISLVLETTFFLIILWFMNVHWGTSFDARMAEN